MPAIGAYDAQQIYSNAGLRTQYGVILPPGARVAAFVRSTGVQSGDDAFLSTNLVTTLAAGLARARPGMGDFVVCLPGHTENVTDGTTFSNALVAGTKIVGVGRGSNQPLLNWTQTAGRLVVSVDDVIISGLRLQTCGVPLAGSNTTLAISVTGNDFGFFNNDVQVGHPTNTTVVCINCSGSSSRFDISNNVFRSTGGGPASTTIVVSSIGTDGKIADNEIFCGAASATGNINVTAAMGSLKILRNYITNQTGASVAAIGYSNVACTGQCAYNTITVFSTGAQVGGTTGITVGGTNNLTGYFQNFVVNDPNKSGILQPAADT